MSRFRSFVAIALVAASLFALWASCAVYDGSLLVSGDAGDGALPDVRSDANACARATVPERPPADDPAVTDGGEITLAVSHFDFAPTTDGGTLRGLDLDRSCTCPGTPSCKSPTPQCDDDAGRDNVGGLALDNFAKIAPDFKPDLLNERLASGVYGLLVRLRGWNGAPNDGTVEVALYVSKGTALLDDAGTHVVPKFDGTDTFTVAKASLLGGVAPPYIPLPDAVDTTAYVRDGVLVANEPNVRMELSTSTKGLNYLELNLTGVVLSAKISRQGGKVTLEGGLLAGRWPTRKFLIALAPLFDPLSGSNLCGDASTYQATKSYVCARADISSAVQNDNTNASCDALSFGLGFTAVPATFGLVSEGIPLTQPCGPAWTDDCAQ